MQSTVQSAVLYCTRVLCSALGGLAHSAASACDNLAVALRVLDDALTDAIAAEDEVQDVEVLAAEDVAVLAIRAAVAMHDGRSRERKSEDVGAAAREPPRRGLAAEHCRV